MSRENDELCALCGGCGYQGSQTLTGSKGEQVEELLICDECNGAGTVSPLHQYQSD